MITVSGIFLDSVFAHYRQDSLPPASPKPDAIFLEGFRNSQCLLQLKLRQNIQSVQRGCAERGYSGFSACTSEIYIFPCRRGPITHRSDQKKPGRTAYLAITAHVNYDARLSCQVEENPLWISPTWMYHSHCNRNKECLSVRRGHIEMLDGSVLRMSDAS